MSVANPCSVLSPDPLTSHSVLGEPVRPFSQTIGLGPHCAMVRAPAEWSRRSSDAAPRATPLKTDAVCGSMRFIAISALQVSLRTERLIFLCRMASNLEQGSNPYAIEDLFGASVPRGSSRARSRRKSWQTLGLGVVPR